MSDEEKHQEEKKVPTPTDEHPLVTSVGSGEDDYESADDEADEKTVEKEVPDERKESENSEEENVKIEVERKEEEENETKENDDAASTSSKGSEEHVVGRRRRNEESDEQEENTVGDDEKKETQETRSESGDESDSERKSGDDEEAPEKNADEEPEDRQNPTFVPRRGNFFQHDVRAMKEEEEKPTAKQSKKQMMMEKQNRWQHDMFDVNEQMPKSRNELVNAYGYDIRHESRAPRDPHGRRYGRSQNQERDWRDPDSYGRRSFGGYRRSFGAGGGGVGGGGRGRGHGRGGGGQRDKQEQESHGSRSVSPGGLGKEQVEPEQRNEQYDEPSPAGGVARSRSFSNGERQYENNKPYNSNRGRSGGYGGYGQPRQTYGTVEFRRRGRGTAFASNQRGGGGISYDNANGQQMSRRSAEGDYDRSGYNENSRGGRQFSTGGFQQRQPNQAPPKYQSNQGSRGRAPFSTSNAFSRRSRDQDYDESNDKSFENQPFGSQQNQQHPNSPNTRQQGRNQDRMNNAASSKRYSAIRQQSHAQPNAAPAVPPQGNVSNIQRGAAMPMAMPQNPPNVAPMTMMTPSMEPSYPPPAYPPYFNGSGLYQQAAPVPVQEVYSVPPAYADGTGSYVIPTPHGRVPTQPFMGQQQYPPGYHSINQPMPHYQAETREAYASGGTGPGGGTVYFDPGSQQPRPQRYHPAPDMKRRPNSIPIVPPEQSGVAATEEGIAMSGDH